MFKNNTWRRKYNILMEYRSNNKNIELIRKYFHPSMNSTGIKNAINDWFLKYAQNYFFKKEPFQKKKINYEDLTREELIKIIQIYEDIANRNLDNKKKKFAEIAKYKDYLKLNLLCSIFGVTKQGFYYWSKTKNLTPKYDEKILEKIKEVYFKHKGNFGYRRIATHLMFEHQIKLNKITVQRYMKHLNLKSKIRIKKRNQEIKFTDKGYEYFIKRDYKGKTIDEKWFTDVSYIKTSEGWKYLSIVIDAFNNRIVDWKFSNTNDAKFVLENIRDALKKTNKIPIINSDHGIQYYSEGYRKLIANKKFIPSMSRVGNSLDNRPAEYFFSILKQEFLRCVSNKSFTFLKEIAIPEFMNYYHKERVQSNLQNLTPFLYLKEYNNKVKNAKSV